MMIIRGELPSKGYLSPSDKKCANTFLQQEEEDEEVNKEFYNKIGDIIEYIDTSRNKILLIQSENLTKRKEVTNEYDFLKKVGEVCKKSCDYYFDTNIKYHEACENFSILFKIFYDSLIYIVKKNEEADHVQTILQQIEDNISMEKLEKEKMNILLKDKLNELEKNVFFMKNESVNLNNKIQELDYQINQHKESFDSFSTLTNLNCEKLIVLQNQYNSLTNKRESITRSIAKKGDTMEMCKYNFVQQKKKLEEEKNELMVKEKEYTHKIEHLEICRQEICSNNTRLQSQVQFVESQVNSQEYYEKIIEEGLSNSMDTKKEIEENLSTHKNEINKIIEKIKKCKLEKKKGNEKYNELQKKFGKLQKELEKKENDALEFKKKYNDINEHVKNEEYTLNQYILQDLKKKKNLLQEEITNYKEEIKTLILKEKEKKLNNHQYNNINHIDIKDDIDTYIDSVETNLLIQELEYILNEMKKKIKEEEEEIWKKNRELQNENIKINELQNKINEEYNNEKEINSDIQVIQEKLIILDNKEKQNQQNINHLKEEINSMELKNNKNKEEIQHLENKINENKQKIENHILQIHKEYEQKNKILYETNNFYTDINSKEKKQLKDDIDTYTQQIKIQYDLQKEKIEKQEKQKVDEEFKYLDQEIKKKDDLLNYYKELLNKQENNTNVNIINYAQPDNEQPTQEINPYEDIKENRKSIQNKKMNSSNTYNNFNKYKLYTMPDQYKIGYFDVTSPNDMRRKSIKYQNRSVKSPHITRLLEKIKNRKECHTLVASKKTPLTQANSINEKDNNRKSSNHKALTKTKKNQNDNSFDLFQHL
ncbi:hypothetical protein PFNF135_03042 [Plasmodium falciparum NF135/5.C10]|uniref:Uncharacterized protein n=2 Tax=Plasmodium falciparum TaxID=5833 RepID=A0A024V835_PLAFA|nr:hypothetical protein PFFVO_02891 [Plasmodium falciparum Vietnam Oak-Knoll (FVO)]ETW42770.1 hypothetical protein PFNF135_03042 [Plasmodium falciparum NF135/5.C10]